jgi:hypothetical protein
MKPIRLIQLALSLTIFYSCEEKMSEEVRVPTNNKRIMDYTLNGTEGGAISLETFNKWTGNYTEQNKDGNQAHFFGTEIITQILAEEGCMGIRMYYALDDSGNRQILLVGVDAKGNDLLPSAGGRIADGGNIIADMSFPCPTHCTDGGLGGS